MSKKVVRLTESQLRLMINKVINEQKTPVAPQKNQKTSVPVTQKLKREDFILKEMLENLSKGIYVYASKMEPTKICIINPPGFREYNGVVSGTDIGSVIDYQYYTVLDNIRQREMGQARIAISTRTMEEALTALNNNKSVVVFANDFGLIGQNGQYLSDMFMYLTDQGENDIEKGISLLKMAQPNIVPKLIQSLETTAKMERDRDRNQKYYSLLQKVIQITGQQPQQPQQQK